MSTKFVYRLIEDADWRAAQDAGEVPLREIDVRDGYIHLSSSEQVLETANLYFADAGDVLALEIDAAKIEDALRWEPSRGGALFPHLYSRLPISLVHRAAPLVRDDAGRFRFAGAGDS